MKNTQRCIPTNCKGKHTRLLVILGGLLLLFPLLLPATALAASRNASAAPPLTKPQQIVDLAGVSVVRLSIGYLPVKGSTVFCTALGSIIASWPAQNATDKNNWVLTDGSLLNTSKKNSCALGGTLLSIKIFASNEFTNSQPASAQLGGLTCTVAGVCADALDGVTGPSESLLTPVNGPATGAVLFSFHTARALPFVDLEQAATTGQSAPTSIELANTNGVPPASPKNGDTSTSLQFLSPLANTATPGSAPSTPGTTSTSTTEPGMPFIDGNGKLTGMQLLNPPSPVTTSDILTLEKQPAFPQGTTLSQLLNSNTLSQQWDTGIIDYELGNNQGAVQTLNSIQNALPTFQAPAFFIQKARANLPTNNGTPGSTSTPTNGQGNQGAFSFLDIPLLVTGLLAAVVALALFFLIFSIRFRRRRVERKREQDSFEADQEKARQNVERAESRRHLLPSPAPAQNVQFAANTLPAPLQPTIANLSTRDSIQPQQPVQAPQMQNDPAIQAALERLWDKAGR